MIYNNLMAKFLEAVYDPIALRTLFPNYQDWYTAFKPKDFLINKPIDIYSNKYIELVLSARSSGDAIDYRPNVGPDDIPIVESDKEILTVAISSALHSYNLDIKNLQALASSYDFAGIKANYNDIMDSLGSAAHSEIFKKERNDVLRGNTKDGMKGIMNLPAADKQAFTNATTTLDPKKVISITGLENPLVPATSKYDLAIEIANNISRVFNVSNGLTDLDSKQYKMIVSGKLKEAFQNIDMKILTLGQVSGGSVGDATTNSTLESWLKSRYVSDIIYLWGTDDLEDKAIIYNAETTRRKTILEPRVFNNTEPLYNGGNNPNTFKEPLYATVDRSNYWVVKVPVLSRYTGVIIERPINVIELVFKAVP